MKALVADDEVLSRRILREVLFKAGWKVVEAADGREAIGVMYGPEAPSLAVLDWMMPQVNGLDVCRELRRRSPAPAPYLILVTAKDQPEDAVAGLEAGADDYVRKPFDPGELRARVQVGARILGLQQALGDRVSELEQALEQVKQLQGLLPICAWCRNVRDDGDYWESVEAYVARHSSARFTHTICPSCEGHHLRRELERKRGATT